MVAGERVVLEMGQAKSWIGHWRVVVGPGVLSA
jgi:hypothetical protein